MTETYKVLEEMGTFYDTQIIEPLRDASIAKKLITGDPRLKGDDIYEFDQMTIGTLGDAVIEYRLPDDVARDMVSVSTAKTKIPFIAKGFQVEKQDYVLFKKNRNIDLEATAAIEAAFSVQAKEEKLLLQGWAPDGSTYVINGLYQGAGNTYGTSKDFGTYGNAKVAIMGALELFEEDNVRGCNFNLALNPVQYFQLMASENASATRREWDEVMALLNGRSGAKGEIFSSPEITAGTGMVSAVDPSRRFFDYKEPVGIQTVLGMDSRMTERLSPIFGTCFELIVPNIKKSEAICTLTAI